MSRFIRFISAAALALTLAPLHAQEMHRSSGDAGNGLPPYNRANETRLTGTVRGTGTTPTQNGESLAMLDIDVKGELVHVMLAPQDFVKKQGVAFTKGATVEATGVAGGMKYNGDAAMMAREVKVGEKTLVVRDADGKPAWGK